MKTAPLSRGRRPGLSTPPATLRRTVLARTAHGLCLGAGLMGGLAAQAQTQAQAQAQAQAPAATPASAATLTAQAPAADTLAQASPADGKPGNSIVRITSKKPDETATGPVKGLIARRTGTATKTDTPLIETPQSITIVTRDQLEAQNAQSITDALRYTSGVAAEANGPDPRADVANIRGFSAGGRAAYRDGLRDFAFGGQGGIVVEPYGLERIEVLRGPSSVLYGQGDAGGIINLVSKRPTEDPLHEVQLQLGSFDRKQAALDFSGPIGKTDEWRYRLTALVRDSASQVDYARDDRTYLAPTVTWRPSDDTEFTVLAYYQKNKRVLGYQALPQLGTLDEGAGGTIPTDRFVGEPGFDRFDQEQTSLGYEFRQRLASQLTFQQNFRVMRQETLYNSTYYAGLQDDGVTIRRFAGQGRERVRNLLVDNQFQWKPARLGNVEQTVLFGIDYQDAHRDLGSKTTTNFPSLNIYEPVYGAALPATVGYDAPPDSQHNRLRQTGVYLQDQVKFGEKLAWTVGARQDQSRGRTDRVGVAQGVEQNDDAFTWRTGLVYLAGGGLAPYVGFAKSFNPTPGVNGLGEPLKPETGKQVEIGVRFQPENQPYSLQAAVYDLRRQNLTTPDPAAPLDNVIQTGEARSRGLELEAKGTLWRQLDLIASYTYNDLEISKSTDPDKLGKTPSASPKTVASLWAGWRVPSVPGLTVSGGVRRVGSSYGDEYEQVSVPGYTLVDAGVVMELGNWIPDIGDWRLALNVTNLADKKYVATCGYYPGDGCKYGFRRNAAATLTYRW